MALSAMAEAVLAEIPFHWVDREAAWMTARQNAGLSPIQMAPVRNALERAGVLELREAGKMVIERRTRRGRYENVVTKWEMRRVPTAPPTKSSKAAKTGKPH